MWKRKQSGLSGRKPFTAHGGETRRRSSGTGAERPGAGGRGGGLPHHDGVLLLWAEGHAVEGVGDLVVADGGLVLARREDGRLVHQVRQRRPREARRPPRDLQPPPPRAAVRPHIPAGTLTA